MILKSITPHNFGPFINGSTLRLESDVTVLTGPNDAGKSLALRAIQLLCTGSTTEENEVNFDRRNDHPGKWDDDSEVHCDAEFEITPQSANIGLPQKWASGTTVFVRKQINIKNSGVRVVKIRVGNSESNPQFQLTNFPQILLLPLKSDMRHAINLGELNDAESHFVRFAFGPQFNLDQHKGFSEVNRSLRIDQALEKVNTRLKEILPPKTPMRFKLFEVNGRPEMLGIALLDHHKGHTPFGSRGSGVKRLLSVMGAVLRIDPVKSHTIILYDEPETSLHSDAQHMLRRLLETIAEHPTVQVVYTTHSSAMMNTMRPESIRVLERSSNGERAFSRFNDDVYANNYARVRASLGISPADSLLYAPLTLIVEGPTEVLCLPRLLLKLKEKAMIDGERLDEILSQVHLLDGEGSSFEYLCRLAKSQNAKPVVFLDGDKARDAASVAKEHPDVPVISLPTGIEFEQIISMSTYIRAAAKLFEGFATEVNEASFREWEKTLHPKSRMMFSKRVEQWLKDTFDHSISKPKLMDLAIEMADASEIDPKPFQELVKAIKAIVQTL